MSIQILNKNVDSIYVGSQKISELYYGTQKVFGSDMKITIVQKPNETIHVITGDGVDHTESFAVTTDTVIKEIYATGASTSSGVYEAGEISYSITDWTNSVTTEETLKGVNYTVNNFPSTFVDGTNFIISGSYAQSGSVSYNVNSGHSKGYITVVGNGNPVTIMCYSSSENNWDFGYAYITEGTTPTYASGYSEVKSATASSTTNGYIAKSTGTNSSVTTFISGDLTIGTTYTISFGYIKDSSGNTNDDRFYIQSVVIPDKDNSITTVYVSKAVTITIGDASYIERTLYTGTNDIYIAYDTGADNGATYTFYDSTGNVISNPSPGTAFRSYTISGTPTSDRYICAYSLTSFYTNNVSWSSNLYNTTIDTSEAIGTGKSNTTLAISKNTDTNSIFYKVNEMNTNKVYGYDDWFIPSYQEMVAMYNALPDALIWNKDGSQGNYNYIWTSSEYSSNPSEYAWRWYGGYGDDNFFWGDCGKYYCNIYFILFPVRGF